MGMRFRAVRGLGDIGSGRRSKRTRACRLISVSSVSSRTRCSFVWSRGRVSVRMRLSPLGVARWWSTTSRPISLCESSPAVGGVCRCTARRLGTILRLHLADVAVRGYALDDEENDPGVRCISAPVFNAAGEAIGCIGIDGPSVRVTEERIQGLAQQVVTIAQELTARIAGLEPADVRAATA